MTQPRIIIADDFPLFREGLEKALLSLIPSAVILHATHGNEVFDLLKTNEVDLIFIDIQMPGAERLEIIRLIREINRYVKIVAVTMLDDIPTVIEIFEAGANGYLHRNTEKCKLQRVLEVVFKGNMTIAEEPASEKRTIGINSKNACIGKLPDHALSNREVEVLGLICQQLSSREIAHQLRLTEKTVETHRNHLMWKTQSKNVVGLIMYAIEHGYFDPSRHPTHR